MSEKRVSHKTNNIEPVYRELGHRLRWLRETRGLTLKNVCSALGLHDSTLAAWERGQARLGVAEIVMLCKALGVRPSVLIDDLSIEACQVKPELRAARKRAAKLRKEAKQAEKEAASVAKQDEGETT